VSGERPRRLDDAALLDGWERARALERPWSELALLALTEPGPRANLALLPIGERDRRLLELRSAVLGRRMEAEIDCPACGERLELELDAQQLQADGPVGADRTVRYAGRTVDVRPPDSNDVAAALGAADPEHALLARCTDLGGEPLPDDLREAVIRRMAELDPGAELVLDARCPGCGEAWRQALDPAAFVLDEVDRLAMRLLREVDQLARAYGWREGDVLALSPARRRAYLELAAT
jgi:hypothetical protein